MRPGLLVSSSLLALVAVSCSSVRPVAVHAGDQCFRCRRIIAETKLAGEIIDGKVLVTKFRTPACMARYLADHPADSAAVFVTDYATGKLIPPDTAIFVPFLANRDTGERDYRAYHERADADAAAIEVQSVPTDWKTVLEHARL